MNFSQQYSDKYYLPEAQEGDVGFLAFILPDAQTTPPTSITFEEALTNTQYGGSFIFSPTAPSISNGEEANTFVDTVDKNIIKQSAASRGIIWLNNVDNISNVNSSIMGLAGDGSSVSTGLQAILAVGLNFEVDTGMPLSVASDSSILTMGSTVSSQRFSFSGPSAPTMTQSTRGSINFAGAQRGCVQFPTYIDRQSLNDDLKWGFQFLFPITDSPTGQTAISEWLPIASGTQPSSTDKIGFNISIDPTDPFNKAFTDETIPGQYALGRTYFDFTGKNFDQSSTQLVSYYRTVFGHTINLVPVISSDNNALPGRMTLSLGEQISQTTQNFHLSPEGDFLIQNGTTPDGTAANIICGMQGTEFFTVTTANSDGVGDKFRFVANKPAYAANFPFQQASPVAAPPPLDTTVISNDYTTSWATIIKGGDNDISYVSQPKGSALFGKDSIQGSSSPVYGHTAPGFSFVANDTLSFPIVPYQGLSVGNGQSSFTADQTELYESQILSGVRRELVAQLSGTTVRNAMDTKDAVIELDADSDTTTTTPSGLIATLSGSANNYTWDKVLLGQNLINGSFLQMYFSQPNDALLQALQTSDLFLVVGNNANLGDFSSSNSMQIGDWGIQANVGSAKSIQYNDYSNIIHQEE